MGGHGSAILELENAELEVLFPEAHIYVRLFACYLLENKLYDAKFLWKRIPQNMKAENEDLKQMHIILQALIANDIADFFNIFERDWSDDIKVVMEDLRKVTETNIRNAIGNAYSSVKDDNGFAKAERYQLQYNCLIEETASCGDKQSESSEYQISRLTEFVSFLEN